MRKNLGWIFAFSLIAICLYAVYGSPFKSKPKVEARVTEKKDPKRILYELNQNNETVVLLAVKNRVEPKVITEIFTDYCNSTGLNCISKPLFAQRLIREAKQPIYEAIKTISEKHNLSSETIANILIDERKLREVDEECILPSDISYEDAKAIVEEHEYEDQE